MYDVWIPVYNREWTNEELCKTAEQLRAAGTNLVVLTFGRILRDPAMLRREREMFDRNAAFFRENGFEICAWLAPTLGYGGPFYGDNDAVTEYTHVKRLLCGEDLVASYCPLDERFAENFMEVIRTVAGAGVTRILLEDDFALGSGKFLHDAVCACDRHLKLYREKIGENLSREEIAKRVLGGGGNPYRDAWLELMADTMKDFSRKIEQTAHAVDPEIRVGPSANHATFGDEGTNIADLARVLAGKTKPFLRMTGAPYWKQAQTLAPCIEAERVQSVWCEGVERITEGDTYPRPRHWVPANHLEFFDMILRADGGSEGILKYMIDYNSSATYETGYIERHRRNAPHYAEIERRFSGKRVVGLHIFENVGLFGVRDFEKDCPLSVNGKDAFLPTTAQWFAEDNSIPTTYRHEAGFASLAFGANAAFLTEEQMRDGVILDATGARILFDRGIDIGITSMEKAPVAFAENFPEQNERTLAFAPVDGMFYRFTLKEGAITDSEFVAGAEGLGVIQAQGLDHCTKYPACFRYENAEGMRFMIYSFIAETVTTRDLWVPGLFRNYCRQRQLADGIRWLCGRSLPAMCLGNPELYILCKKDENSMAVGLWNLFADSVLHPVIELDDTYRSVDFYRCKGHLDGNRLLLDEEIPPYGFAFFTVCR